MSRICAVTVVFCVAIALAPAQDQKPTSFDDVYTQWTDASSKIDEVIKAYRAANSDERPALVEKYQTLAAESRKLLPKLRAASIAQFGNTGNKDARVTKTLVGMLANDVRQDKYDDALKLGGMLIDGKCEDASVDCFMGIAAYCTDDFASAATHLTKAQKAKSLTQTGEICLQDLPTATTAWKLEKDLRAFEAKTNDLPRVRMETSKGTLLIELYENEAPQAVGNFVSLVEAGYYDGLTFHRVLPGFMAQGGCPDGTGTGGPGYKIFCECQQENHRKHFRGTLSMAHAGQNTGGSQFFLTFKRTSHLDGRHTVFGRVIEGLEVLEKLQRRDPGTQAGITPDRIVKAEVVRKRKHEYKATKVGGR